MRAKCYITISLLTLGLSTACFAGQGPADPPPNTPAGDTRAVADSKDASAGIQSQAAPSTAGSNPSPTQPQRQTAHHVLRATTIEDQVKRLGKVLELTEAQQAAVHRILELKQRQILQLREDTSLSGADRINRIWGIQQTTGIQINALLNAEQKQKYSALAQQESQKPAPQTDLDYWLNKTVPPKAN